MKQLTKLTSAAAITVILLPTFSLAQTKNIAEIQAEIASLTAQLNQLEAQLTAQGSSSAWCYTFADSLSIGMSGDSVTALQTALQKDGESIMVNGRFDDQTAAAVTSFQAKYANQILAPYGLSNGTGYAGKATRAKLNSLFGCDNEAANPSLVSIPEPWPTASQQPTLMVTPETVNGGKNSYLLPGPINATFDWNIPNVSSTSEAANFTVACVNGVQIVDVTNIANYKQFMCGDYANPVSLSGSVVLQFDNSTGAPVTMTGQLDYPGGSTPLTATVTVNP